MRVGISTLCVVAAVAVIVGTMDDSRRDAGAVAAGLESTFAGWPTPRAPATTPVVVTVDGLDVVTPPTTAAAEPQALVATTAFVPTTAHPTSAPTTVVAVDLRAAASCSVTSAVRPGNSGDDVRCVQLRLRQVMSVDLGSDPDGRFGPGTETAVRRFQQASGLSVDGVVGASTARILGIWQDRAGAT